MDLVCLVFLSLHVQCVQSVGVLAFSDSVLALALGQRISSSPGHTESISSSPGHTESITSCPRASGFDNKFHSFSANIGVAMNVILILHIVVYKVSFS